MISGRETGVNGKNSFILPITGPPGSVRFSVIEITINKDGTTSSEISTELDDITSIFFLIPSLFEFPTDVHIRTTTHLLVVSWPSESWPDHGAISFWLEGVVHGS